MSDRLTAYIDGRRVGQFTRGGAGVIFTFDDDWRAAMRRMELSLSLPKSRREHTGTAPENYLWNLLPDNDAVLQRWGTKFGVSPRNPMALLANVGLDTAGAVQLTIEDAPALSGPSSLEPIGRAEIAAHIRQLRADPEAWLIPGHGSGYFSLAGAQSKFALARAEDGWAVPIGRAPSTHIFKPGIHGLSHSDLNEHLTMAAARSLGLDVADSRIEGFEDETVIVVERYDRALDPDGMVLRLHQEDMAQAAGVHPAGKYQNEGGPGIARIVDLIRSARGKDAEPSVQRFFEATLFNWAALGTDAHAKNYSLLHDRQIGPRLAPLYDLATTLPYPDVNSRNSRLAMAFSLHYRQYEIEPRHILADAAAASLDSGWVLTRASEIVDGLADAFSQAAADAGLAGDDAAFSARIVDEAHARAQRLRRELDRVPNSSLISPAPSRSRQPRNKDVAKPGNPGSFASRS